MEGAGLPGLLVGLNDKKYATDNLHSRENRSSTYTCDWASVQQGDLGCTHSGQHQL